LEDAVNQCPYEGTDPLRGTEICDEKAIVFQDESCPGNTDRQTIRYCFELATGSFVGEPTCSQMQIAIAESAECFVDVGCCQDLEQTISEWKKIYPTLADCTLFETGCAIFGSDNVVEITAEIEVRSDDLTPDSKALLRASLASSLEVQTEAVLINSVSGRTSSSLIRFNVAYETAEQAASVAQQENFDDIVSALIIDSGVPVKSLSSDILTALTNAPAPTIPSESMDLWTTGQIAGIAASLAAVLVVLALLIFFEEKSTSHQKDNTPHQGLSDIIEEGPR